MPVVNLTSAKAKKEELMAKTTANSGEPWATKEVQKLRELAKENTPTRVIGLKLGRTPGAVYQKASEEKIPLKPTNQSPYNRRKS
jgi:hypothetical protein